MAWYHTLFLPPVAAPSIRTVAQDTARHMRADAVLSSLTATGNSSKDPGAAIYMQNRAPMSVETCEYWYESSALARRLVDVVADGCVSEGWRVDSRDERDVGVEIDEKWSLRTLVQRLVSVSRWGGGAAIVPVVDDGQEDWSTPLRIESVRRVDAVHVMGPRSLSVAEWDKDVASPNYGHPRLWWVSPEHGGNPFLAHWTRVLYMPGYRHASRSRRSARGVDLSVYNYYRDAILRRESLEQSAATIGERIEQSVVKFKGYTAALAGADAAQQDAWKSRAEAFSRSRDSVGVAVLDTEDDYDRKPLSLGGFDSLITVSRESLALVEGIPQVKLVGDTPSGLNSDNESGRREWSSFIGAYQETRLQPVLRRLYPILAMDAEMEPRITFEPVDRPSARERAEVYEINTRADVANVGARILMPEQIAEVRYGGAEYDDTLVVGDDLMTDTAEVEAALLGGRPAR